MTATPPGDAPPPDHARPGPGRTEPFLVRHGRAAVLLIVAGALALRVAGTSEWWLNPDEGIYFSLVTRPTWAGFWAELRENAHPPLYYLLLRATGALTTDFFWFRALSLVAGAAAVGTLWAVGRALVAAEGGTRLRATATGLVAAALLAASPTAVVQSQIMRPYMLQLALVGGALALLLGWKGASDRRALGAYVALVTLALLTHYSSVLALAALGCVAAFRMATTVTDRRSRWVLVAAHGAAGALFAALWVLHLRGLAASDTADDALRGWLSFYLVGSPREAWLAFLGLQTTVLGRPLGGLAALILMGALALAAARRAWLPLVVAGSALSVGLGAAAAGVYPMGATRHSIWMLAFTVPAMAWALGLMASGGWRRAGAAVAVAAVLVAARTPVGDALGVPDSPWAAPERVLRQANLAEMLDVLDPEGSPRLILMDLQTYYLLLPFYYADRTDADVTGGAPFFHFRYGRRDVVVARSWLATLGVDGDPAGPGDATAGGGSGERDDPGDPGSSAGPAPSAGPAGSGDLRALVGRVDRAAPELGLGSAEQAVVLVGGWRSPVVDGLLALEGTPTVAGRRVVPGLFAFLVDPASLAAGDGQGP